MEVGSACGTVEAVAPVDADEAEHGHEDSHAEAGGVVEFEGLEVADVAPTVAAFEESENPDGEAGRLDDGLADFDGVAVEDRAAVGGAEGVVVVATQGHHLATVEHPCGEAVAAHKVATKGRLADVFVKVAHPAETSTGVEDHIADEVHDPRSAEVDFVVFDPAVFVLCGGGGIVLAGEERIGRGDIARDGELGTAAGVDGGVVGVAAEGDAVGEVVGVAVGEEVAGEDGVVVEGVVLVGKAVGEEEIVVGPFETTGKGHAAARESKTVEARIGLFIVVAVAVEVVVDGDGEGLGTFAAEPGFGEGAAEGVVVGAVGDGVDGEFLAIACGQRRPSLFVKYVAGREVVEGEAHLADNHAAAVAALELYLACLAVFDLVDNVDGGVLRVGTNIGDDFFFLKVAEGDEFAAAAHDGVAAEEIARTCVELAHDDAVVGDGVALDDDVADAGLFAFGDADFDIDGVVLNTHFDGGGGEEQIAVIHVEGGDVGGGRVVFEVHLEEGAVVGVALLDAEMAGQHVGGIDGVAGEGDVAEVEFVALVDFDFHFEAVLFGLLAVADVELILRDGIDGVGEDTGITVAVFVVVGDDAFEVFVEFGFLIFGTFPKALCPETEFGEIVDIVGVGHLHLQLNVLNLFVALEDEGIDFDTFATVDVESDDDAAIGVVGKGVDSSSGIDGGVGVAFFKIVGADSVLASGEHVLGNHVAGGDIEVFTDFLIVALGDTFEGEHRHLGTAAKLYFEEDFVGLDAGDIDLHIFEEALFPKAVDSGGKFVARDFDHIAHLEAGDEEEHSSVEIIGTVESDASDFVLLGSEVVDVVILTADNYLCTTRKGKAEHQEHRQE